MAEVMSEVRVNPCEPEAGAHDDQGGLSSEASKPDLQG